MSKGNEVKVLTLGESKVIAGVSSGLAEYFGLNKNGVRLSFLLTSLFFLFPLLVYIVLWLILPRYPSSQAMRRQLQRMANGRRAQ
jgi:phage shock protein PspC (stress-responsive transcriptional regulator)